MYMYCTCTCACIRVSVHPSILLPSPTPLSLLLLLFTVEKFCIFLQFMKSSEVALDWDEPSPSVTAIKVTIGYSFCLAVQLLKDKTSNVTSRAHYCLGSLTTPTVEVGSN